MSSIVKLDSGVSIGKGFISLLMFFSVERSPVLKFGAFLRVLLINET